MKRIFIFLILIVSLSSCHNNEKQNINSEGKLENNETREERCERLLNEFKEKMTPIINEFIESLIKKDFEKVSIYLSDDCGFEASTPITDDPREVLYTLQGKKEIIAELKDEKSLAYITLFGSDKRNYKLKSSDDYELLVTCLDKHQSYEDMSGGLFQIYNIESKEHRDNNGDVVYKENIKYGKIFVIHGKTKKIYGINIILPESFFKGYERYFNKSSGELE